MKGRGVIPGLLLACCGVVMVGSPWYAELFTAEVVEAATVTAEGEFDIAATAVESWEMMYVPPWVPLAGGVLLFFAGVLTGRGWKAGP